MCTSYSFYIVLLIVRFNFGSECTKFYIESILSPRTSAIKHCLQFFSVRLPSLFLSTISVFFLLQCSILVTSHCVPSFWLYCGLVSFSETIGHMHKRGDWSHLKACPRKLERSHVNTLLTFTLFGVLVVFHITMPQTLSYYHNIVSYTIGILMIWPVNDLFKPSSD